MRRVPVHTKAQASLPAGAPPAPRPAPTPVSRAGQASPTASMLQAQLAVLQTRERRTSPAQEERPAPPPDRRNSYSDRIASRLVQKPRTPSYGELQARYSGTRHSPSPAPVLDRDYQKEARQTVVGELASYGGVQQASRIAGPRKKPSQSPSMRLLGLLHIPGEPEGGRCLPPRPAGGYQRSLSSQL